MQMKNAKIGFITCCVNLKKKERKNKIKKEKKLKKFKLFSPAQVKQKNVCLISLNEKINSRCRNHQ